MNRAEAIELCEKYGVNYSEHPQIIVTSGGNIYTDGNVDPADAGQRLELNVEDAKAVIVEETGLLESPKEPKKGKK